MTLVLGLRCRDGVVLASDSQRTDGDVRESVPKLFTSPAGTVWGKAAIRTTAAHLDDPSPAATTAGGIFAWHSRAEHRTYLLRVQHSGAAEFRPNYTAIGPGKPQSLALRALEDTLGAFRTHQRDDLVRDDESGAEPDTGVRP
jgi:hypothetical protein